jgi:peptidoglycan/xylan/chitin deacetylase (PgdA/CDA1 family)
VDVRGKFACLMYHAIKDSSNKYAIGRNSLKEQLTFLSSESYVVEGFRELELRLRSQKPIPRHYVVLTVDDGDESCMCAADMFAQHGFEATFFLTRDKCLNEPGYIRPRDIRELRSRGFSVGTHGTTHRGLSFMPRNQCAAELRESKEWLEDLIGERVEYMSAPGGHFNRQTRRLAFDHGYVLTGDSTEWMNDLSSLSLPGNVYRVAVRKGFTVNELQSIVEGRLGFYLKRQVRAAALLVPKKVLYR